MKNILTFLIAISVSFLVFVTMTLLIDEPEAVAPPEIISKLPKTVDIDIEKVKKHPMPSKEPKKRPEKSLLKSPNEIVKAEMPDKEAISIIKTEQLNLSQLFTSSNMPKGLPVGEGMVPGITGIAGIGSDRGLAGVPKVTMPPMYPIKAEEKGIEGYVTLSFDINEVGSATNIKVVDAEPKGYFERSAKKALRRWRYEVYKKDGKGTILLDQKVTMEFKMDKITKL